MKKRSSGLRGTCAAVAIALSLSGCANMPTSSGDATTAYATSCLVGAVGGAVLAEILNRNKKAPASKSDRRSDLIKAAAGGCAVGLAVTAVGRMMNERQRTKHEEEMQKEVQRRALEQQQYAGAMQKAQSRAAATPQQRAARDAELERARAAYQTSVNKPLVVDLGEGGTSTIQVQPATPPAAGQPAAGQAAACTDYAVFVKTASGQARQYETWCPNASGQMVRAETRETAAG